MSEHFNKLLERQLKRHFNGKPIPEEILPLLESISESYDHYERDNKLIERAMDLSSEELMSTNQELRKINAELDRFVYSASHDLRAPLSSILGLLNLLEHENKDDRLNIYFSKIHDSILRLDVFIKDIIDYSRNSRMGIDNEHIDFKKLIYEKLNSLYYMPGFSFIDKKIHINDNHHFFNDAKRISILFNNLISNAIKYFDPAKDYAYLKLNVDISDDKAHILIEDNGLGIDKEHHEKIFDMFYKASDKSFGTGLGLYIVKETIKKLNGSIEVNSEVSIGTSINLTIPNRKHIRDNH